MSEIEEKIRKWYADKPHIMEANVFHWGGFFGNSSQRFKKAMEYAEEVEDWLKEVFCNGEVRREENKVYLNEHLVFSITSSIKNVYREQDLPYIKRFLKEERGINLNKRTKKEAE